MEESQLKELNYGHKPDMSTYNNSVDPDAVSLYADENCKHCYGRGYEVIQVGSRQNSITIRYGERINTFLNRCTCVEKNMKKYG